MRQLSPEAMQLLTMFFAIVIGTVSLQGHVLLMQYDQ